MVTGQVHVEESGHQKTEVLDLGNLENECEALEDFPSQTKEAVGGLIHGIPVICGGMSLFPGDPGTKPHDQCYQFLN